MIEEELDMFTCGLNHVSSSAWHTTDLGIARWIEHFISLETQVLRELCADFDLKKNVEQKGVCRHTVNTIRRPAVMPGRNV